MLQQAVEHGGDRGGVAQKFSPVFDRAVRSQQRAGALVAAHITFCRGAASAMTRPRI